MTSYAQQYESRQRSAPQGDSPPDVLRRPGSVSPGRRDETSAKVPFPLSAGPLWKALLMASAPLSCSMLDYSKFVENVNHFRLYSSASAAFPVKSSAIRLSPYTGMPAASSSAAVTPSPPVNPPEKLPSWITPRPQEGLSSFSTAA